MSKTEPYSCDEVLSVRAELAATRTRADQAERERDEAKAAMARKQYKPDVEDAMEWVEVLGDENCPGEEKGAAVTDAGNCLICGLPWAQWGTPGGCRHDEIQIIAYLRTISSAYVDCICPGCPRKVPMAWMSGTCEPCALEDCEHTDGAKAVAAEREELQVERDRLAGDLEEIRQRHQGAQRLWWKVNGELEAHRAALADTPENLRVLLETHRLGFVMNRVQVKEALAAIRSRIAIATTPGAAPAAAKICAHDFIALRVVTNTGLCGPCQPGRFHWPDYICTECGLKVCEKAKAPTTPGDAAASPVSPKEPTNG